jgi:hypothetical protein
VIVPVTPVGTGLRPAEVISVEPSGIPAGDAPEPDVMPSGDVAPIVGVGVTVPSNGMSACARATLQENSAARTTAADTNLVGIFRLPIELRRQAPTSVVFATGSLAVRLSDIGQSPEIAAKLCDHQQRQMFNFSSRASSRFCCWASNTESLLCSASLAGECG